MQKGFSAGREAARYWFAQASGMIMKIARRIPQTLNPKPLEGKKTLRVCLVGGDAPVECDSQGQDAAEAGALAPLFLSRV